LTPIAHDSLWKHIKEMFTAARSAEGDALLVAAHPVRS